MIAFDGIALLVKALGIPSFNSAVATGVVKWLFIL